MSLGTQQALSPALGGCKNRITRLDEILENVLLVKGDSSWDRSIKAFRSLNKDREVQSLFRDLDRYLLFFTFHNTSSAAIAIPQLESAQQVIMIPANRDLNFVDRPEVFRNLQDNLKRNGRAAIAGVGGVG